MRQSPAPVTFQTLQTLSDLRSVAATGFGDLATCLRPGHKPVLRRVIFDQQCRMTDADGEKLAEDLMRFATRPDVDQTSFMTSTALLLADRIQGGAVAGDFAPHWGLYRDTYRKAPSPVRAAITHGFRRAFGGAIGDDGSVAARDLVTFDADDLRRLLCRIARSMTADMRDSVCKLADEETRAVHRHALDNCLSGSCILSEYGGWFPGEVVEKASLDAENPGHAACTALVLLDAFETRDAKDKMAFRWERQADGYLLMRPEFRAAIIAGFRNLHEMAIEWQPYDSWTPGDLLEKAVVVPFAKP